MINCIFIDKGKNITLKRITERIFDNEIYNNSGIVKPSLAGFIRYLVFKDYVEMKQIFVSPECRRGGYGRLLIKEVIKLGNVITISNTNKGEVFGDFLIKMGFTQGENKIWKI